MRCTKSLESCYFFALFLYQTSLRDTDLSLQRENCLQFLLGGVRASVFCTAMDRPTLQAFRASDNVALKRAVVSLLVNFYH